MFGVSFTELMLIGVVALIVVGPQRLPGMMATVGKWSSKLRRMLFDVRAQSGIDDILRAEGITGGLNEIRALRNAVRGNVSSLTQALTSVPKPAAPNPSPTATVSAANANPTAVSPGPLAQTALAAESDPYANVPYDRSREYPDEGCDAYGAIPDDLWAASRRPHVVAEPVPDPVAAPSTEDAAAVAMTTEGGAHGSAATAAVVDGEAVATDAPALVTDATAAEGASATTDATAADAPTTDAPTTDVVANESASVPADAASPATATHAAETVATPPPIAVDADSPGQINGGTSLAEVAPTDTPPIDSGATAQPTSPSLTASSAS